MLIAATGNRRAYRQSARDRIDRFLEVYVECALETCRRRDLKGIYARAESGQATQVPGVGSIYEPPERPDVVVATDQLAPSEAAALVLSHLVSRAYIRSSGSRVYRK